MNPSFASLAPENATNYSDLVGVIPRSAVARKYGYLYLVSFSYSAARSFNSHCCLLLQGQVAYTKRHPQSFQTTSTTFNAMEIHLRHQSPSASIRNLGEASVH